MRCYLYHVLIWGTGDNDRVDVARTNVAADCIAGMVLLKVKNSESHSPSTQYVARIQNVINQTASNHPT